MDNLEIIGQNAKEASYALAKLSADDKNKVLKKAAKALVENKDKIIKANEEDLAKAKENGIKGALLDRLTLNEKRIKSIAEGLEQIAQLEDPIGEVISMWKRPNGITIGKKRVPIGVIGIIYEARPNVTVDVFGLCLKSGNASILRGGKEAINSNIALVEILQDVLKECEVPKEAIQLIKDTNRETAVKLMKLNKYLDLLIPRGGAGLIQAVIQNSTVPVIETGVGNCHIYVDESGDINKAVAITLNAKTSRPGVCNAAESLLVHKDIADKFLPKMYEKFKEMNVEVRGDERVKEIIPEVINATDDDWSTEYLDYIIAVKVVDSVDEAISHINTYGTKHSEAIVTENYSNAQKFLDEVDAAAVYVNASTRFTDGFEFGFGAEIGISTQKLHARGPMGLKELTSTKYVIYGDGQIRE
ncbi:glutamate-5-semialdehyde dehydrogenase [Thermohalobacter berrensis]|uniref:Gamma-glutamyl phosphate reductase n=1 Tax=Thermohalobacter berrensis TaxID=99594 RepID=A0A419T7Z5_9FIRM|nr:glutamate-5-semialdehyde dehydrogenase [Thermohalobacter berrensis]RKD33486.1 glutamate-5-semialdehyde dehydrogenase [Thermohalobacter berrensis]